MTFQSGSVTHERLWGQGTHLISVMLMHEYGFQVYHAIARPWLSRSRIKKFNGVGNQSSKAQSWKLLVTFFSVLLSWRIEENNLLKQASVDCWQQLSDDRPSINQFYPQWQNTLDPPRKCLLHLLQMLCYYHPQTGMVAAIKGWNQAMLAAALVLAEQDNGADDSRTQSVSQ